SASFRAVTVPVTGAYTSETLLVDSTSPMACPDRTFAPTSGRFTNTMSPSASWACSVMPTRTTLLPPTRTHSCSAVYFRFSGVVPIGLARGRSVGRGRRRLSVLRRPDRPQSADHQPRQLHDPGLAVPAAHGIHHAAGDVHGGGQGGRVADGANDVRRGQRPAVHHDRAARRVLGERPGPARPDP